VPDPKSRMEGRIGRKDATFRSRKVIFIQVFIARIIRIWRMILIRLSSSLSAQWVVVCQNDCICMYCQTSSSCMVITRSTFFEPKTHLQNWETRQRRRWILEVKTRRLATANRTRVSIWVKIFGQGRGRSDPEKFPIWSNLMITTKNLVTVSHTVRAHAAGPNKKLGYRWQTARRVVSQSHQTCYVWFTTIGVL